MLNRLFIVVGVLAILAIAAAFIVPRFIQWGDYRDRMQVIASEVLGAPVEIVGDIEFSLLPQPQLKFADVKVGPADAPVITIAEVEAQFSLIDFLRDRYHLTKLVLDRPALLVGVDEAGRFNAGIVLAEEVTTSNVSVGSAKIVDGALTLTDARSGEVIAVSGVAGELRMDALRGPFSFQGGGTYGGRAFTTRLATSALDDDGASQLSLFIAPADEAFSLSAEGRLTTALAPSFKGTAIYRQLPPAVPEGTEGEDVGRGDLVLTGSFEADPERILLPEYTIVPDENRAAARLTGEAEIRLGAGHSFNARISGGVLSLPPRDATADQGAVPYELVRLLAELQVPPVPSLPGTIGVDIAEINLRALALRNVRFDVAVDGEGWTIDSLSAQLPGNSNLTLSGTLGTEAGRPNFAGTIGLATQRLDGLATLWRRPPEGNPLFNMPGSLDAQLSLVGETLSVSDGVLGIEEEMYPFTAEIGFEPATRHLNFRADLGELNDRESEALFALLPDARRDDRFAVTFPKGKFQLSAATATVAGLAGQGLAAAGFWEGGVLALDKVTAADLGGMSVDATVTAFGSIAKPEFSGTAKLVVASASAPALTSLFDAVGTPAPIRSWLEQSLPADLQLSLDAPSGEGGQSLSVKGRVGAADMTFDAQLGLGIVRALQGPMTMRLDLRAADPTALTAQLGLGEVSLTPEGEPMHVVAVVDGMAANSFETTVRIEGGAESLAFAGNLIANDLEELSGNGNLQVTLSDLATLTEQLGAGGLWLPAIQGSARIDFDGLQRVRLAEISASSGGEPISGEIEWTRSGATHEVTGKLNIGRFTPTGILALLAGPAATINTGAGYWPDGPVAIGDVERTAIGQIAVKAKAVLIGETPAVTDPSFNLTWDATGVRIRDFAGTVGGGKATAELAICCAGPLPQKQVSGRLALEDVAFASVVPKPVADAISATVDAAARFEGTGDSLHAALAAMTGEGSYMLNDVTVSGFDPSAFAAIASLDTVLEMAPDAVTALIVDRLDDNPFTAASVSGAFTVAGGVFRSPNVAIEGNGARLFGSTNLRLFDLGLSGGFAMSPTVPTGPDGLLTEANAQIAASFGGTLPAPRPTFDVAGVVDTIMVMAYEIEVARLEELRAEDEARAREAAAERARIAAEETARLAAEDEAERQAEEEAARQAAEEEAARPAAEQEPPENSATAPLQPGFNLNLQPTQPNTQF